MQKNKIDFIIKCLQNAYPNAGCQLDYGSDFQLLISVILSAQCTDKRVNVVTSKLFKIASTPSDFVKMPLSELEQHIFSCGFYHSKAKSIKAAAIDIEEKFNGLVPSTLKQLTSIKGVGQKTANVILSEVFKKEALAVDTHVFRVSHRLGLSNGKTPLVVEKDLTKLLDGKNLTQTHHLFIFFGRYCCKSQNPDCNHCPLSSVCTYTKKTITI